MRVAIWKASSLVLAGALAYVLVAAPGKEAQAEPQPHMKLAEAALENAASQLEKASSDKGGHRVAALKLTREAIEEARKGIDFDNGH